MLCENCGKEVPEGNEYCMDCGAPLVEPVVIKVTKIVKDDKPAKEEPQGAFIDISGYTKSIGNNINNFLALIGAVILYLSIFMTWLWDKLWDTKKAGNLFDLGGKNGDMTLAKPIMIVFAILGLITGISMLIMSARNNIRPLKPYANNYIIRFIPVIVGIVIFILIMRNKEYIDACAIIDKGIKNAKMFGASDKYDGGKGIGPILYLSGLALYALSVFIDFMNRKEKNG